MTVWTGTLPTLNALHAPTAAELGEITDSLHAVTDAWTQYTPTWSGSGGNPVIGNGTLDAAYFQAGKFVHYVGRVFPGSTTTFGSGTYSMSLPVTAADVDMGCGSALVYDASAATARYPGVTVFQGASAVIFYANNAVVTAIAPFTWATGDRLIWHIVYEAA